MFDKLMTKVIPPRLGLDAITANAVERLGHPIKAYVADLFLIENKVDLLVTHPGPVYPPKYQNATNQHKYWLEEGPLLIKALRFQAEEMAKKQGAKGEIVHITIEYNGKNEPYVLTFYVKEGDKKIKLTETIK